MNALDHLKVKEIIKEIFKCDTVSDFVSFPSSVNTLLQFVINNEKYMIKILTLPTLSEWENYRLDKEGKLLEFFSKHDSLKVPVPELIHIENNVELIGYRFIIYRFVDGQVLWNVWRDLTPQERIPIMKELGKLVRDIHSVKYDWFGELEDIENVSKHSNYKDSMLD
ncbi:MAG: aminoglycoside phosphotransferase family protein [Candidatus Heimdallarchaeota archaeon]